MVVIKKKCTMSNVFFYHQAPPAKLAKTEDEPDKPEEKVEEKMDVDEAKETEPIEIKGSYFEYNIIN